MAGDDDDKDKEPTPKPSTEEAGAGDTSTINPTADLGQDQDPSNETIADSEVVSLRCSRCMPRFLSTCMAAIWTTSYARNRLTECFQRDTWDCSVLCGTKGRCIM